MKVTIHTGGKKFSLRQEMIDEGGGLIRIK